MPINENVDGATPLDPDELGGLKFKHITTRGQLDELEQANIVQGLLWLKTKGLKKMERSDVLSISFILDLHQSLFNDVWTWAGTFRLTEKNIGIEPLQISVSLRNLLDDFTAWIEFETYPPIESTLRFHHQLVKTHPFPNGNGRFSRIYTDVVTEKYFKIEPVNWGGRELDQMTQTRRSYIDALRAADRGDLTLLFDLYGK